jgi:LysM repeat protein
MYSCVSAQVDNSGNFSDRVFAYICKKDIKHPHIAMQQAIIETGGFYPNNAMRKNNLFGFKKGGRVISFKNWKESVDFYKDWQDRKYTDDNEDYYKFLRRIRYATNKKYISHLKGTKFFETCDGGKIIPIEGVDSTELSMAIVNDSSAINVSDTVKITKPTKAKPEKSKKTKSYTVGKGDTLYDIAKKNKITVPQLKKANKLSSNKIKPGQKLKIPRN